MDRLDNFRSYINSVNRGVLLAVGLVVIAGMIAAAFIYGGDDGNGADNGNGAPASGEVSVEGEVERNGEDNEETDGTGVTSPEGTAADGTAEEVVLPGELAETGPAAPLLALTFLSGTGYLYHRSRKQVAEANLS